MVRSRTVLNWNSQLRMQACELLACTAIVLISRMAIDANICGR